MSIPSDEFKRRILNEGIVTLVAKKIVIKARKPYFGLDGLVLDINIVDEHGEPLVLLGSERICAGDTMTMIDIDQGFNFTLA